MLKSNEVWMDVSLSHRPLLSAVCNAYERTELAASGREPVDHRQITVDMPKGVPTNELSDHIPLATCE